MATNLTDQPIIEVLVTPAFTLTVEVGLGGRPGVGGAELSPDPTNRLEAREDGLYVGPPQYTTVHW